MDVNQHEIAELKNRIRQLEQEVQTLTRQKQEPQPDTVNVPEPFKPIFAEAQNTVRAYFDKLRFSPAKGLIEVNNERYVLIRASSLAYDFFEHTRKLYTDRDSDEAFQTGRDFLFDIGHVLGMEDARCFHEKMDLRDPVQKLSAGPVHFAHCGWAFVDILPQSHPSPDEHFFIKYHHPYSFEADSWLAKGKLSHEAVCIMNAAYSSGWCEQSFGIPLTAVEISCRAKGDPNCTFIMAPPDKIQAYLEQELQTLPDAQHRPETPLFFNRKISQEQIKASQEKIRQQEHHWQALTHNTDDMIIVLDEQDRIQYINRSFTHLPAEDYLGQSIYTGLPTINVQMLRENLQKAKETGLPQSFENRFDLSILDPHLPVRWFNTKVISFGESQHQRNAILIITDISERKQTEHAVIKSQNSLNEAQQLAHIGSWEFFPHNHELIWSKEMYRIFELEDQAVDNLYQVYLQKCHPEDLPMMQTQFEHALKSGEGFDLEHRIICRDGSVKYLYCLGQTVRDASDQVFCLKGTGQDITERKQIEANLEQATARAQAANLAKDVFLAIISHEIRTPLNGVLGMLQLLKFSPLRDEQRDMADVAYQSGEMLLSLLNDLLDFSKIEAGRLELEHIPFNIHQLVRNTVALQASTSRNKGIEISCTLANDVPAQLAGDPTRLQQVLNNLLSNALKFTEQGSIEVEVRLEQAPADSPLPDPQEVWLGFSVADSGIGIPPQYLETIFEPFIQADSSITRKYGGSGLGLSVSQRLVKAMGGELQAVNRPTGGSQIFFSVRLTRPLPDPSQQPAPAEPGQSPALQSARVLVVEDNLVNQMVAVKMLEKLGFQADVAENGSLGLEALAARHYDLVLMDMMMPVLDGVNATRRLRASETPGEHLPVIAMTANISDRDREACMRAGMDDFLTKPIAFETMQAVVSRWLKPAEAKVLGPPVASQAEPMQELIRHHVLAELRSYVGDEFDQLLRAFFRETEQCLQSLQEAGRHGYRELLARLAHTLKGSSGNFGAVELTGRAASLQEQAHSLSPEGLLQAVTDIEEAFRRARPVLEAELGN